MDIIEEQNKILFNAIRSVATNKKCPDWIKDILSKSVMEAKKLKMTGSGPIPERKPIEVGDIVKNANEPKDVCLYQVIELADVMDNIKLFNVKVVKGNNSVVAGTILHNVGEHLLVKVE